jgi:uncharacterized protein
MNSSECSARNSAADRQQPNGPNSMTLSMYQASVPVLVQHLNALLTVLDKADAFATAKKVDPTVLLTARLAPDMFPLTRQVQIACDFAKGVSARLAAVDVPSYEDTEKSIPELKARVKKTIDFIQTMKPAQIDGSEDRSIEIKMAGKPVTFKGQPYLVNFAMPNFFFHLAMAYGILRHNGVDLGKRDFMGAVPGMPTA